MPYPRLRDVSPMSNDPNERRFRGREFYEEFHEREWEPALEDNEECESEDEEDGE